MEPVFSIIMPAYEVANYIGRAIDSIRKQTFTAWELIVVDDNSTDRTAEIVNQYIQKDNRIRIISQNTNKGVGFARNTGLKYAKGQYIWFMDSDDYVENNLLKKVYESLEKSHAEVVVFGLHEEYYDEQENLIYSHEICPSSEMFLNQNQLRKKVIELEQQTLYGYVWNKVYEKEYLEKINIAFSDDKLNEDIKFNICYFMDIKHMNLLDFSPYHYYIKKTRESLTNSFVPEYYLLHEQRIKMLYDQYRYWKLDSSFVKSTLGALYGRYILSALQRNCDNNSGMNYFKRREWCRKVFQSSLFNELIPYAKAKTSKSLSLVLTILKKRNIILSMILGRGIFLIKYAFPILYSKGKEGR